MAVGADRRMSDGLDGGGLVVSRLNRSSRDVRSLGIGALGIGDWAEASVATLKAKPHTTAALSKNFGVFICPSTSTRSRKLIRQFRNYVNRNRFPSEL